MSVVDAVLSGIGSVFPRLADAWAQGAVALVLAGLAALAVRRAQASLRHAVWAAAVAGILVLPALRIAVPGRPLGIIPAGLLDGSAGGSGAASSPAADRAPGDPRGATGREAAAGAGRGAATAIEVAEGDPLGVSSGLETAPIPAAPGEIAAGSGGAAPARAAGGGLPSSLIGWLALAWLAGAVACLGRYAAGAFRAAAIVRRSRPLRSVPAEAAALRGAKVLL